jgi:hypothetical protein
MLLLPVCLLTVSMQAVGSDAVPSPLGSLQGAINRASKEADMDAAGSILASYFSDESKIRAFFSTRMNLDERSAYILFGGNWGSRASRSWKERVLWHKIQVEAVSSRPELIRSIIRVGRYDRYFHSSRGAATINHFSLFENFQYADDMVEMLMETLRKASTHAAEARVSQDKFVLVTADEMETKLLGSWQVLCGLCDRLDLIENASSRNWRDRFPQLDTWFQKNRPYIVWDNDVSCMRIDGESKESGFPTPRSSRSIPELKPSWMSKRP